jgi:hypothetical protein
MKAIPDHRYFGSRIAFFVCNWASSPTQKTFRRNKMNTFHKLAVLMSAAFLLTAISATAQINEVVKFDAPFAFYAGNAKMPAGSYTLTRSDDNGEVLKLENVDHSQSVFVRYVTVDEINPSSSTEVSFKKYGNTDFLNSISLKGENSEIQIMPSNAEQSAAQSADAVPYSPSDVQHSLSTQSTR